MKTATKHMRGLVAALLLGASGLTLAAAPGTVGYQGRLYDQNGNPLSGTLNVVFALYPSGTGGSAVWTETQSVTFNSGYFAVQLGAVSTFGAAVFDGTARYLGVTVGTDSEMTPRASVASVPYALNAVNAVSAVTADSANTANTATTATTATTALSAPPDSRFGSNTSLGAAGTGSGCVYGQILLSAGGVAGAIPAQGQILSISANTALFSLLGTTYGGNGTTTFALPDLRSAAPNGLTYSICTNGIYPGRL